MTKKQEFIKQYVTNYTAAYYASHLKDDSVITPNETDFVAIMSIKSAEKVWNTLNEKEFFGILDTDDAKPFDSSSIIKESTSKSTLIKDLAKKLNLEVVDLRVSEINSLDIEEFPFCITLTNHK